MTVRARRRDGIATSTLTKHSSPTTRTDLTSTIDRLRSRGPLVHNITNYVVMNSTANALLAAGASPAMVHALDEVGDFAPIAQALVINIGTLSAPWVAAMEKAAEAANAAGVPWILDPVAAGATELGANDTPTLRRTLAKAGALDAARSVVRTDLVAPLRDRLERSVIEGGGDNDDITRRVRSVYREWKTQHIDDQLDDVFRFAFGGGIAVTVEPGTPMRWTIDPSEPACADCEDNSLAGPVAAGDAYPTGHTMAPAHPGCRCLTVPARQ